MTCFLTSERLIYVNPVNKVTFCNKKVLVFSKILSNIPNKETAKIRLRWFFCVYFIEEILKEINPEDKRVSVKLVSFVKIMELILWHLQTY